MKMQLGSCEELAIELLDDNGRTVGAILIRNSSTNDSVNYNLNQIKPLISESELFFSSEQPTITKAGSPNSNRKRLVGIQSDIRFFYFRKEGK